MISPRQSFAGPWAASPLGWLWMTPPAFLLAIYFEIGTELPDPGWIVLSAAAQLAASALVGALIAASSRALTGRVTLFASLLLWVGLGAACAGAGAATAIAAGVDPEWAARMAFWVAVSCTWMPLLTYCLAQWEERRRLVGLHRDVTAALAAFDRHTSELAATHAARIAEAADDALRPALTEIHAVLHDTSATLDSVAIGSLRQRLDVLADRAVRLEIQPQHPEPDWGRPASVGEASADFEIRRPLFAAALTAAATAPFLLPAALRGGGWGEVAETGLAIGAATVGFAVWLVLLRRLPASSRPRLVLGRIGGLLAGSIGSAILVTVPWQPLDASHVVFALALPVLLSTAASSITAAVGLAAGNEELDAATDREQRRLARKRRDAERADALAARRLLTLTRGELNGRLASCALALGLLATGGTAPARRAQLLIDIRAQLDAAVAELIVAPSAEVDHPARAERP
jgi:hypothetical protein